MPNWCSGTLRIRGEKENIILFFREGTEITRLSDEESAEEDIEFWRVDDIVRHSSLRYVKETERMFIEPDDTQLLLSEDHCYAAIDVRRAWDMDAIELAGLCKIYDIDMRLVAFERNGEFSCEIEIINGEITKNEEHKYENYTWDCICPLTGG